MQKVPAAEQSKLTQRYLEEFDRSVGEGEPREDSRRSAAANLKRGKAVMRRGSGAAAGKHA